jgi:integrase
MARGSVWIRTRPTKSGGVRHRVEYRLGGREAPTLFGGSFGTKREASIRKVWILNEIAAGRAPNLNLLVIEQPHAPTLGEACDTWRETRIDVTEGTRTLHRVSLQRVLDRLGRSVRIDTITADDVAAMVAAMAADYKRETIKKSRDYLANVLDHYEIDPNPAKDKRVKLPRERKAHVPPPLAAHVERVAETLPRHYVVPFLVIDECGPRVGELETAQIGDLDEDRRAIRVRWTVEKNDRYRHLELPDDLFAAIVATLPAREDRDLEAPLFPDLDEAALRTSITRACKATGTPHFSPHGLRRRRGSLHY